MNCPSQEMLQEWFSYEDGQLFWKISRGRAKSGDRTGTVGTSKDHRSYVKVRIKGRQYLLHRLVWVFFYGDLLEGMVVDHIDGNTLNNKVENLRMCTVSQNGQNIHRGRGDYSSLKGISFSKKQGKYVSQIRVSGKNLWLGSYNTAEEAHQAYCKAAKDNFGGFANTGKKS